MRGDMTLLFNLLFSRDYWYRASFYVLLAIHISSLVKYLFTYWGKNSFCVWDTSALQSCGWWIFAPSSWLAFVCFFKTVSLKEQFSFCWSPTYQFLLFWFMHFVFKEIFICLKVTKIFLQNFSIVVAFTSWSVIHFNLILM